MARDKTGTKWEQMTLPDSSGPRLALGGWPCLMQGELTPSRWMSLLGVGPPCCMDRRWSMKHSARSLVYLVSKQYLLFISEILSFEHLFLVCLSHCFVPNPSLAPAMLSAVQQPVHKALPSGFFVVFSARAFVVFHTVSHRRRPGGSRTRQVEGALFTL